MGCGLPVPADAPGGICPECLLKSDLPGDSDTPEPTPTPVPGEPFGDYRIIRLLGHGGMGRVYEAEHIAGGRRVALKVIGKALASEADRKRFLREGRLAAAVNHPNVVYIHGSEEVEGVPIIAMELVHGGTLKDRLKREGALSVRDAVESAIQIIDGLEAAQTAGVLHRDIKPANCFIAQDGTLKVGDFGLSVSTLARGESLLTATGAVMGTPAYASPEQLRGEELDVRSDIYSVGATLYHLLTGNTPFTATDFVKLITEVLDKQAASPTTLRNEVPAELSRVILRCLAKDRKARFQTYNELREALLPFGQVDRVPANPGVRFIASIVDDLIAYLPSFVFLAYWALDPLDMLVRDRTLQAFFVWQAFYGWYFAYYTICEGVWGSGLGKTLCGLRVVDVTGQAPGLARASLRNAIFLAPGLIPSFVLLLLFSRDSLLEKLARGETLITDWAWIPLTFALFVTIRRRNGFAAIHDLLSRTRVIVRPRTQQRPRLAQPAISPVSGAHGTTHPAFGPYETRALLWRRGADALWLAYDLVLRRQVWVHCSPDLQPLSRRDLSRPGRLRWLNGGSQAGVNWNSFEAPSGAAWSDVAAGSQRWSAVRFWLLDLAEEAVAAQRDAESAPVLSLDRIWITSAGRALLLDFPAPARATVPECDAYPVDDSATVQAFLHAVATRSLEPDHAQPLHARQFLDTLERRGFDNLEFIPGNLQSLLSKPAEFTRSRRVASLALVPAVSLLLAVLLATILSFERVRSDRLWSMVYPDRPSLRHAVGLHVALLDDLTSNSSELERACKVYMAHHFADVLTNETFWMNTDFADAALHREHLGLAITSASNASPDEIARAEATMTKALRQRAREERFVGPFLVIGVALFMINLAGTFSLAVVLLFGVNPVLHLFGIAVVTRDGRTARRGRLLLRWLISWAVIGIIATFGALSGMAVGSGIVFDETMAALRAATLVVAAITALAMLACAVHAALRPSRSISDLISGTRLVPR